MTGTVACQKSLTHLQCARLFVFNLYATICQSFTSIDCQDKIGSKFDHQKQIFLNKMNRQQPSLIFCVLMDLLGYATYAVPLLGEIGDVFWAPLSSIIFFATFGGWKGVLGGFGNFVEELLPGTDFIPSFTIMWFIQNMQKKNTTTAIKLSGR